METIRRTKVVDLLKRTDVGAQVNVKGWVRTRRGSKQVNFVAINDGSTIHNVQVVVDVDKFDADLLKLITTGACLSVNGTLVASVGSGQAVEIHATDIEVLGTCDSTYPLQKKGHSMEFLREIAHLRPRTNTFGAVFRIRHHMAYAIHKFFHEKGFFYFHTPIITASDCEGAGQMFQVTTMNLYDLKKDEKGSIIYDDDFFGKQTSLTVSGQLEGELAATSLGAIYTFGPTFRAENSNTPRHLAEFWMIEPEVAFNDITDNMDLAEEFIKYCVGEREDPRIYGDGPIHYYTRYFPINRYNLATMAEDVTNGEGLGSTNAPFDTGIFGMDPQIYIDAVEDLFTGPLAPLEYYDQIHIQEFIDEMILHRLTTPEECAEKIQGRATLQLNE